MTRMTYVTFTDGRAMHPTETGLAAWRPLDEYQRKGARCLDCGGCGGPTFNVGSCEDGTLVACVGCYIERLKDHIDYYQDRS